MMDLDLSALFISHFQACKRRSRLEQSWKPHRWRAKTLWENILREAIFLLSSGTELDTVIQVNKARFLGQCANPGLDIAPGANPFIIAKDWAIALEMVLRSAARLTLLKLHPVDPVRFPLLRWRVSSPADDSGVLHRWLAVDRWDQEELSRQAHSWLCFGDMAMTRQSMMLHVVETGQIRSGRRDSCWTRGYKHRYAPNLPLRFKRPEKNADVIPQYLADQPRNSDPEQWVDMLLKEGLIQKHIHHVTLEAPSEEVAQDTIRQVLSIAEEAALVASAKWSDVPMSRSACDGLVACPWQDCCYRWPLTSPEDAGYVKLNPEPEPEPEPEPRLGPRAPSPDQSACPAPSTVRLISQVERI